MRRRSRQRRRLWNLSAAVALLATLAACGPAETDPDALRADDGTPLYADGTYAAAFSHVGPEGWRPFLELRVHAGMIDRICFDAVDAEGVRLSEDEAYLERKRLESGTDLQMLLDRLTADLRRRQSLPQVADPDEPGWSAYFEVLARRALTAAQFGVTVDAAGVEVVPISGPYVATDEPDRLGWRAELVLAYDGDGVVAASYRELRTEPDGTIRAKHDDEVYQSLFAEASGTTSPEVAAILTGRLLASGDPAVDAVTGATLSSARFVALATRIGEQRVAAPLPNRLCR
jgi:major membrane immunogen (membrane-anchored lipoprotein)